MALDRLLGERRHARGNLAVNRHIGDANFLDWRNEGARLASVTVEKTFALQGGDVLHHRSLARETEVRLDLAGARCDSLFALLGLDEFQDASLPLGKHVVRMNENAQGRKF